MYQVLDQPPTEGAENVEQQQYTDFQNQMLRFLQQSNDVLRNETFSGPAKQNYFAELTNQIHGNPFFQAYRSIAFQLKHNHEFMKKPPQYDPTLADHERHLNQIMVSENLVSSPLGGHKRQYQQSGIGQQKTTTTPKRHVPVDEDHAQQLKQIGRKLTEFDLLSGGFRHECEFQSLQNLVQFQSLLRPIYDADVGAMQLAMEEHWAKYRIQLKLEACQQALALRTQLDEKRKKRRNFSKESVELLNQYYFDNIDHPYPDDNVKMQLAARTGLTIAQVSNWFGNKRIRHRQRELKKAKKEDTEAEEGNGAGNGQIVNGNGGEEDKENQE